MKLFVTGATGAVGRFVVPLLVAQGHDVTALARTEDKAKVLQEAGATAARVSIFDPDELAATFAGHDVVLNLATAIPPMNRAWRASSWAENNRIRSEGSKAVVDAALAAGVEQVVQESITFIYPDHGDAWISEDLPVEPPPGVASVGLAEANAQRLTDAGGRGVVLRFGAFYGPGSSQSDQIIAAARRHIGLAVGRRMASSRPFTSRTPRPLRARRSVRRPASTTSWTTSHSRSGPTRKPSGMPSANDCGC